MSTDEIDPLAELSAWIEEARAAGLPQPASVAFVTVGEGGLPSARTVTLKWLEDDALVFTSALWTRKAREIAANPNVALLFHWRPAHAARGDRAVERSARPPARAAALRARRRALDGHAPLALNVR